MCEDGSSESPNEIVICDKCGLGEYRGHRLLFAVCIVRADTHTGSETRGESENQYSSKDSPQHVCKYPSRLL